jgi:hypothetical protein
MLKRLIAGALAGAFAVGPLTGVLLALKRDAIAPAGSAQPAAESGTTEGGAAASVASSSLPFGLPPEMAPQLAKRAAWGAAWGALFGLVTGIARPTVAAGLILGLGLGKASQDGWIPPLDPLPESTSGDERGELPVMAAYAAFGLALGIAVDRLAGG